MATITVGRHREYQLPVLGFAGSPVGIDVRKVLDTGVAPVITTGIAHREPGIGQIGAGLTRVPMQCFAGALDALAPPLAAPTPRDDDPRGPSRTTGGRSSPATPPSPPLTSWPPPPAWAFSPAAAARSTRWSPSTRRWRSSTRT